MCIKTGPFTRVLTGLKQDEIPARFPGSEAMQISYGHMASFSSQTDWMRTIAELGASHDGYQPGEYKLLRKPAPARSLPTGHQKEIGLRELE